MSAESPLRPLDQGPLEHARYGEKACWLARLSALCSRAEPRASTHGACVPAGFAICAADAARLCDADGELERALESALAALRAQGVQRVAVRASATLALPGALLTRLCVACELTPVLVALREVVGSAAQAPALDQLRALGQRAPTQPWVGVVVQTFVEASAQDACAIVLCTRDPRTGAPAPFGEYLERTGVANIVSGRSEPLPLAREPVRHGRERASLEQQRPELFAQLGTWSRALERAFEQPLELELLFSEGVLWALEARPLALAPRALTRLALEAIEDDSPSYGRWIQRVIAEALPALIGEQLPSPEELGEALVVVRGLAASPGIGRGALVFDSAAAQARSATEPVVLVRPEALPEDVAAFRAAAAVVTTSGGLTSHAAVIARGLHVPAIVGASSARIDRQGRTLVQAGVSSLARGTARFDPGRVLASEGEVVTVDAQRGVVYRGLVPAQPRVLAPELDQLLAEARKLRRAPLWAVGTAERALSMRELARADGALCTYEGRPPPTPRGRDVWLELSAREALDEGASHPLGYGWVLRGELTPDLVREVRNMSRLRPLGVRVVQPTTLSLDVALDLLVAEGALDVSALSFCASRVVRVANCSAAEDVCGHVSVYGGLETVACPVDQVLMFALALATVGRGANGAQ